MRNLFVLFFLAIVGYLIYTEVFKKDPPPIKVYKQIVNAWIAGDMSKIRPLCEEPRTETYFEARSFRSLLEPMGYSNIVETKFVDVVSQAGESATDSKVRGRIEVFFNPPGVKSENYASWRGVFMFDLGLKQVGEIWKITSMSVEKGEVGEFKYK